MTVEPLAPWYSEPGVDLYQGDTRAVMAQMPAGSVDCVVFSPPFFGLRKYAGAQELVWGGKDGCEHSWQNETFQRRSNDSNPGAKQGTNVGSVGRDEPIGHSTCSLCGAWRGAWGLEPSVEMWVAHTLEVMQAVKRVLKPTGVVWLEVGDSYGTHTSKRSGQFGSEIKEGFDDIFAIPRTLGALREAGIKEKDLCLVPERLALALQADGWWVRSRIVWAKPNPMPESVSDRPTKSHSVIWMLTKGERYYWDNFAVREGSNITANVIQWKHETMHSLQKEPTPNRLLPKEEPELLFSPMQGMHEGKGDGMETDTHRPDEALRNSQEIFPQREGEKTKKAERTIGEVASHSFPVLEQPCGESQSPKSKQFSGGQGQVSAILPETADDDSGAKQPDRKRMGNNSQETEEPMPLLRAESQQANDRTYHSSQQGRHTHERQCSLGLPQLQQQAPQSPYAYGTSRQLRDVWTFPTSPFGYELCQACGQIYTAAQFGRLATKGKSHGPGKYWDYETEEYTEDFGKVCRCGASDFLSHFAVFPEALPSRCILASTSEAGCCPKCGKPWERKVAREPSKFNIRVRDAKAGRATAEEGYKASEEEMAHYAGEARSKPSYSKTLGWAPTCKCSLPQAENVPATVLDVCSGSGTTVLAAKKLGRRAVGIDLSEKYLALSQRRLSEVPMSLVKGG